MKKKSDDGPSKGARVGETAPNFSLPDQMGKTITLRDLTKTGPVLLAFYPEDFSMVCTKQLCNYRDHMDGFKKLGVQIVGISGNSKEQHEQFAEQYTFPFVLLSDPGKTVAKSYGCSSFFMFGGTSRAVFVVSSRGELLYRYVEPTVLTHRKADELLRSLVELKAQGKLV